MSSEETIRQDVRSSVYHSVMAWWPIGGQVARTSPILAYIGRPSGPVLIQVSLWERAEGSWLAPERRTRRSPWGLPLSQRLLPRAWWRVN